jgi:16S rRNA G966 N2-methylase RsmD
MIRFELAFDKKYKTHTKTVELIDGKPNYYPYQGASYYVLKEVFSYLDHKQKESGFVDFGAGKGKAMIVAAECGFTKITGVEFSDKVVQMGQENLKQVELNFPDVEFQLILGKAEEYKIQEEESIFYFFNPFAKEIMDKVVMSIMNSYSQSPRLITIIYLNPLYADSFFDKGFKLTKKFGKKNFIEALILSYG